MGDVAAAPSQALVDDASLRPKSSLMKKLSFLLHPKKSKSKSGSSPSHKQPQPAPAAPPPLPAPLPAPTGSELELLLAQAEATLGELLVRAGASFEARSSSYSFADQRHHPARVSDRINSHGEEDVSSALIMGSSSAAGSRSAKFSGHGRRRSLSRVWQQLGGSLFCGSGHMNAYVMDHDMMAPAPSSKASLYDDVVLDEAYWQSLADAMLQQQQQQQQQDSKVAADHDQQGQHELSCRTSKDEQNDQLQQGSREHNAEHLQMAEEEEYLDRESEIVPSIDAESMAKLQWPSSAACGSSGRSSLQDMDSMYYRNLIGVESGGGCTRLNTMLDESPNLAHNYLVMKVGGTSNYRPEANSRRDTGDEVQAGSSSSMQPLERFLWEARSDVGAGPSNLASGNASSPSAPPPDSLTCQDQPAPGVDTSATASCRVSLMALLHEEAAAGEPTATLDARPEEEEAEVAAAALVEEEGRRTRSMRSSTSTQQEDPLQCCVCMIRRKGAALIPCGHTFCRACAKQLFAGRGACPLCNNLIVQVLDIF